MESELHIDIHLVFFSVVQILVYTYAGKVPLTEFLLYIYSNTSFKWKIITFYWLIII